MLNFRLGITFEHRYQDKLEVYCNRCGDSIGTLTLAQARDAIFNTIGRGGILCPACRARTCDQCGNESEVLLRSMVGGTRAWLAKLCPKCEGYMQDLQDAIERSAAGDYFEKFESDS